MKTLLFELPEHIQGRTVFRVAYLNRGESFHRYGLIKIL